MYMHLYILLRRVSRDTCVKVWSTRHAYMWWTRCVESRSVCISRHGKEPPYLTGQSHLIDTRRVPNTLRPPIRHPLLLSASPFSIFFSFTLHLSSFFVLCWFFSFSLSARGITDPHISRARAMSVASAVADFMSSSAQSWKWKYFIRA